MTNSRDSKETLISQKENMPPAKPPVKGGSTRQVMVLLAINQVAPKDRQKLSASDPLVARVVIDQHKFADLRNKTQNTENSALVKMREIDDALAVMGRSKEVQKLEFTIGPLRSEVGDRVKAQEQFTTLIEKDHEEVKEKLVQLLTDIANGNKQPSQVNPRFDALERGFKDREKELESIIRNNDYLLIKIQPEASRVNFAAVAFKSEQMLQRGITSLEQPGQINP